MNTGLLKTLCVAAALLLGLSAPQKTRPAHVRKYVDDKSRDDGPSGDAFSSQTCLETSTDYFSKERETDIRLLSYNVARIFIFDYDLDKQAAFDRILTAIRPDVILFQEMHFVPRAGEEWRMQDRLDTVLPYGAPWHVHFGLGPGTFLYNALASRYPLSMTRIDTYPPSASSNRGVTIGLVDLPNVTYSKDLYIMGVHLKANSPEPPYDDDIRLRQISCDAIAGWTGDARDAPETIHFRDYISGLATDTPMVVMGDFNFPSEHPQPEITLRTGDIQDNATYGPVVKGDWDNTDLTDAQPTDPNSGDRDTWPSYWHPIYRLDRFYYTDSVATLANSFILNTLNMTVEQRANAGLQEYDTHPDTTSDHLPVVMDIRIVNNDGTTRINFQPYNSAKPGGYLKDWGQPYGTQGNYEYGWYTP